MKTCSASYYTAGDAYRSTKCLKPAKFRVTRTRGLGEGGTFLVCGIHARFFRRESGGYFDVAALT